MKAVREGKSRRSHRPHPSGRQSSARASARTSSRASAGWCRRRWSARVSERASALRTRNNAHSASAISVPRAAAAVRADGCASVRAVPGLGVPVEYPASIASQVPLRAMPLAHPRVHAVVRHTCAALRDVGPRPDGGAQRTRVSTRVSTRRCHPARTIRWGAPHCRALPAASDTDCDDHPKESRELGGGAQYRGSTV
jgi:hypothetical protein